MSTLTHLPVPLSHGLGGVRRLGNNPIKMNASTAEILLAFVAMEIPLREEVIRGLRPDKTKNSDGLR